MNGVYQPASTPPNTTDFMAAFPGGSLVVAPFGGIGDLLGWGDRADPQGRFSAVHAALIPKGPHRGKVFVMNTDPMVIQPGPNYSTTDWWYCQEWAIVDPRVDAPRPRFRNYLLPLGVFQGSPNSHEALVPPLEGNPNVLLGNNSVFMRAYFELKGLFCSGHAWTHEGDLVIAGGDRFEWGVDQWVNPALVHIGRDKGAEFLFMLDFARPSGVDSLLLNNTGLYSGASGFWRQPKPPDAQLQLPRWYPTVLLTHRLSRTNQQHTIIVAGGTNDIMPAPIAGGALNDPRNTYESFEVRSSFGSPTGPFLKTDVDLPTGQTIFAGPGTTTSIVLDWFHEYPRLHLLGDGMVFCSGYASVCNRFDPESPPIFADPIPRWDTSVGNTGTGWPFQRHDGCAVHYARLGVLENVIVRLGGSNGLGGPCTDTVEACQASDPSGSWKSMGLVPPFPLTHANTVVLPDGSLLVIGGNDWNGNISRQWSRYSQATGWITSGPLATVRGYHSIALLLPDGRVFVGSGEGRYAPGLGTPNATDYEIFEPHYLHTGQARPTSVMLPDVPLSSNNDYVLASGSGPHLLTCDPLSGIQTLAKVVLMAPGSITHHADMSARYVEMPVEEGADNARISFSVPDEKILPRGYYMAFAVTSGGIPAEAIWVKVE